MLQNKVKCTGVVVKKIVTKNWVSKYYKTKGLKF